MRSLLAVLMLVSGSAYGAAAVGGPSQSVVTTGVGITSSSYEVSVTGTAVDVFSALPPTVTHCLVYNKSTSGSIFIGGANVTSTVYSVPLVKVGNTDGPTAFVADNIKKFALYAIAITGQTHKVGVLGW